MSLKEHFDSSSEAEDVTTDSTEWPNYKQTLHQAVTSSSTRVRIHALKQVSNGRGEPLWGVVDHRRRWLIVMSLR